jgi:L-threonylcarbamoyladenylate synthase
VPIVPATPENLLRAATLLRDGGVVAFPTETVYGLGANAFDESAIARVFEIKQRPAFDPLIVHVLDEAMLSRVVRDVPASARALAERFWPGPLTMVLEKAPQVPDLATAGLPTVGVRMPAHRVTRELLERAGVPLAAPSANPFGYISPTKAEHVARMLGERVDFIVDAGPAEHGLESTIVLLEPEPILLRPGAIDPDEIERAIGRRLARKRSDPSAPLAPGGLASHYAPRTPVRLIRPADVPREERMGSGAITFSVGAEGYTRAEVLSPKGDLREAAARLFAVLHELDAVGLKRIDVEPIAEEGLGVAIMDRLRRASAR